jgi:hypothetical protein
VTLSLSMCTEYKLRVYTTVIIRSVLGRSSAAMSRKHSVANYSSLPMIRPPVSLFWCWWWWLLTTPPGNASFIMSLWQSVTPVPTHK